MYGCMQQQGNLCTESTGRHSCSVAGCAAAAAFLIFCFLTRSCTSFYNIVFCFFFFNLKLNGFGGKGYERELPSGAALGVYVHLNIPAERNAHFISVYIE